MSGERKDNEDTPPPSDDLHQGDEAQRLVDSHRKTALRLLKDGNVERAFSELVRASRAVPMTPRLAASLVRVGLAAGHGGAALTLLSSGLEESEGLARIGIRRQIARLMRKQGSLERAREELVLVLAEKAGDRRARTSLNALLQREQRWEELDASLEKELKESIRRSVPRRAARAALSRARLWGEKLSNASRAAFHYGQASAFLEQARDFEGGFTLRLLWLRALRNAQAPAGALRDAVQRVIEAGERVGKGQRARTIAQEMGLIEPGAHPLPAGEEQTPPRGRQSAQRELLNAGEEAADKGKKPEAAALFAAALGGGTNPEAEKTIVAHYAARGAWPELAQFYRDRLPRLLEPVPQVELLAKLGELLEGELDDSAGAAQAYGQIVELNGAQRALDAQLRLLSQNKDREGLRRALDAAAEKAPEPTTRAFALTERGADFLARGDVDAALRDFEAALALDPDRLDAKMARAEAAAERGNPAPAAALRDGLDRMPPGTPGRAAMLRRLGRIAGGKLANSELSTWAWSELLNEHPEDGEARRETAKLARSAGDDAQLERAIRAQIANDPPGAKTRDARIELVGLLERRGDPEAALQQLRVAVETDPRHKDAWLMLALRHTEEGRHLEAVHALEQAVAAMDDALERVRTWTLLANFQLKHLNDPAKAAMYTLRAENLRQLMAETTKAAVPEPPYSDTSIGAGPIPQPPSSVLRLVHEGTTTPSAVPWGEEETHTAPPEVAEVRPPADPALDEVTTGDVQLPLMAPVAADYPREMPGGPTLEGSSPPQMFDAVRRDPLDSRGYRDLADYFDELGDDSRSDLMAEICAALEGDETAPPVPKLILSASDRAGLRHPALRNEAGELLSLAGAAICRLYPTEGRAAGSRDEFKLATGKGAETAAEALLTAVRILGLRAPDVYFSEELGPPFSLVFSRAPRILVGRAVVKRPSPDAELRFFAGRALFTQNPDLLVLRCVALESLDAAIDILGEVLEGRAETAEAKTLKEGLAPRAWQRLQDLFERSMDQLDLDELSEGARHSANRAGLVVCGGVAPALTALRAKKALESEAVELIRFAASERYLKLRERRLA